MGTGRALRMGRIFKADAGTVIVAMDHLAVFGVPIPALGDATKLIRAIQDGGGDAVLATRGTLRHTADQIDGLATILSVPLGEEAARTVPEVALRIGADMVKVVFHPLTAGFENTMSRLDALTAACDRWDLPVLVETVPGGFRAGGSMREADALSAAARIAVELGAAAIKTFMPQLHGVSGSGDEAGAVQPDVDIDGIRQLCRYVPVPVVMLGGDPTDLDLLAARASAAVEAGAAGVAVGRNVWGHPNPAEAVAVLSAAVHSRRSLSGQVPRTTYRLGER